MKICFLDEVSVPVTYEQLSSLVHLSNMRNMGTLSDAEFCTRAMDVCPDLQPWAVNNLVPPVNTPVNAF